MAYGAAVAQVRLERVTKTFGEGADQVTAVDQVSLDVHDHEFMILLEIGRASCRERVLASV